MKKLVLVALTAIALISFAFTTSNNGEKITVIVTHEVKDYDSWKKGFDGDEKPRQEAGLTLLNVYRSVDNANVITATFEATSAEAAKKFVANPALKENMKKAGVTSRPDIKFLNKVQ